MPPTPQSQRLYDDWKKLVATKPSAAGMGHPFLATALTHVFQEMRVSASLWNGAHDWWAVHREPTGFRFEVEHGVEFDRGFYNQELFAAASKARHTVRGEHAGHTDLFTPVFREGRVLGVIAIGPFLQARPTSPEIQASWQWLTKRRADTADPEFSAYLAAKLSMTVLDAKALPHFEAFLERWAQLLGGEGSAEQLAFEAQALGSRLSEVRSTERVWEAVQSIVDDRFPRTWNSMGKLHELFALGLRAAPQSVLIGLTLRSGTAQDPVAEAVQRDALQRRSVEIGRRIGDVVAGRVGDHGVVFLLGGAGPADRKKRRIEEVANRASTLARREFSLGLHFGASIATRSEPISRCYQTALAAAEAALARGERLVFAEPGGERGRRSARQLRRELGRIFEHHPDSLSPRFERYVEAIAVESGYRTEAARAHLEAGFERLAEPLVESGALDEKSFDALCDGLERSTAQTRTLNDLFSAYRRAVADLSEALRRPTRAKRDQGLRRALDFLARHYGEPLDPKRVARLAGFTPDYFSKLFKESQGVSPEKYVARLRLERAQQLLADTGLGIARIAEMCGFHSQQYFCRVFRQATRTTPLAYRRRVQPGAPKTRTK